MSLLVWLPLINDNHNQGLLNLTPTNQGTVSFINGGKLGKCLSAGNSSQTTNGISYNTNLVDELGTKFSCAVWVRPLGNHVHYNGTFISSGNWNTNCWSFGVSQDNSSVDVLCKGYNRYISCSVPVNQWTHLCCTSNEGVVKLYKNGVYVGTTTQSTSLGSDATNFCVGRETYASGYFSFNGNINDMRLYNHVLSEKEIKELAKGLVVHYPLNGINNTSVPLGYQQLEYIESSGSSYINTGYFFNPEIDSCKVEFKGNDTSNNGMIFADNGGKYFWFYYYGTNGIRVYASNGSAQQGISGIPSDLNKHIAEYKNKHYFIDGVDKGSFSNTYTQDTNQTCLFSYGGGSYGFKGRIYYVDIQREGKTQKIYIPAKRLSDSVIGMYELIDNQFFTSASSTAFTAGTVVDSPSKIYDASGYNNYGTIWGYDTAGSVENSNNTPRNLLCAYINSANNTTNTASGTWYIYGNCELTTPSYLTAAFWCKPVAGYGGSVTQGQFCLTNNPIGQGAGSDYNTAPMNHRDAIIDMSTSTNVHKTVSIDFTANEWHHYAVVYDGRYGKVYKDGVEKSSLDMGSILPLSNMVGIVIGFSKAGGVWRSNKSYYSDFRLYTTALSADDIKELYQTASSIDKNGNLFAYEFVEV